jgi:Cu(I)/Ag(I) efflux system membrane fusion protein
MNRKIVWGLVTAALAGACAYGAYWVGMRQGMQMSAPQASGGASIAERGTDKVDPKTGRRVLYWHDPMVPGHKFDKPGKSPFMDMELVPVYADEGGSDGTVRIDPRVAQNLGVRTVEVERGSLSTKVEALGNVAFNERELVVVQARVGGFVERLHVRTPLERVRKGQALVDIVAPEWVAVQEEYLALRRSSISDPQLLGAARQRMVLAGMNEEAIRRLEGSGQVSAHSTLYAPAAGVVAELGVREGMTVTPGATLFRINGLSSVWLNAEVASGEAGQLKPGQLVQATSPAFGDNVFKGRINALLPQVNATTRTLIARIELSNPDGRLVPGMFMNVDLAPAARKEALLVPSEALIRTGTRSIVIVAQAEGRFQPVEVVPGAEAGGRTEIVKGLEAGQKVVASGQFLIDSEASLKGVMARMNTEAGGGTAKAETYRAEGTVEEVTDLEVLISHGPVPALKWGDMTMPFRNPPSGKPRDIKVGDRVSFEFRPGKDDQYDLTSISRLPSGQAAKDVPKGAPR